jgi:hypothetical protein
MTKRNCSKGITRKFKKTVSCTRNKTLAENMAHDFIKGMKNRDIKTKYGHNYKTRQPLNKCVRCARTLANYQKHTAMCGGTPKKRNT